jgi:hypothetical protein
MPSILNATTSSGLVTSADNSGSLQLQTNNGTTALTIDTSQKVGIGTASPTGKLHVYGSGEVQTLQRSSGSANNYTLFKTESGADQAYLGFSDAGVNDFAIYNVQNGYVRIATNNTERMRITSGGNLEFASGAGFLQLATNQTMRVPSTGGIGYVGNINSATVFQIAYNSTSAGVQLSSGATSWGTFSDSRLKNITGTYTNALNDIAQIQPVKFTWKSDEDSKPQVGVIAQSIQNVVPEAVDSTTIEMDGTEEYLTVRYTELIPLMIASIQELKAELDATKAEVQALKGVA